ncbi:hypothetical protein [Streptacidiphilus melanogenes]|uniref:hypothetical protein n=1 Tax=Streptacidiphilus melanogenes TaxID=411235 RepID=UPI0005A76A9B|nr:hypothetical protein [Streptacidiphilus melanogenes]
MPRRAERNLPYRNGLFPPQPPARPDPVLYRLAGTSALHELAGMPSALGHEPGAESWDPNGT